MRYLFLIFKIFLLIEGAAPCFSTVCEQPNGTLQVITIHGSTNVTEPVLIQLIQSPAFQRLKKIRQYGIFDYIQPPKIPYSRYEHSLGVFFILREKGVSLVEQIAGLLHDVSHTVFSHSLDPLFMGGYIQGAYQDVIQEKFMEQYGIKEILERFGFSIADVSLKKNIFLALDQELPDMCADRIEYNLYAGHKDDQITPVDHIAILRDLQFDGQKWYFTNPDVAKKFAVISLWQTLNCWGSVQSMLTGQWVGDVLLRAFDLKLVNLEDVHFRLGDDDLWKRLHQSSDADIQKGLQKIMAVNRIYRLDEKGPVHLRGKFRGIDPLVKTEGRFKRLTEIDPEFAKLYFETKKAAEQGWHVFLTYP